MRHLSNLVYVLAALVLLTACSGGSSGQTTPIVSSPTAPTFTLPTANLPVNSANVPLVAKVNGDEITLPDYQKAFTRSQYETAAADMNALAGSVLDDLIEQKLIEQAAKKMNIIVTDADVDHEVQSYIALAGGETGWQNWLTQNGYSSEADFRATLPGALIAQRVSDAVTKDLNAPVLQVHARHILVRTEAEAKNVLARLQAGEDFATLAIQLSMDVTSSQQGGDLGWFTQDELLQPEVARVAFSLKPGQIAGPVTTALGYHVVQTLEFAERPIDDSERLANLKRKRFEGWLAEQAQKATIERYLSLG